jgi:hypothetical protein
LRLILWVGLQPDWHPRRAEAQPTLTILPVETMRNAARLTIA